MKAVLVRQFGGPEMLEIGESPEPARGEEDLLVEVKATALNRADLLQRMGQYPPPKGESEILGLEMAGVVLEAGPRAAGFKAGDRVCALLPGGGYAERAVIPANMAIRIPDSLSFEQAAAVPEVFLTAFLNLFWLGKLETGSRVLVHAGASGVGTAAVQLVREAGGTAYVTAGSADKIRRATQLGAAGGWNYHDGSFVPWIKEQTGEGVDIILDFIGGPYFKDNLDSLRVDGRLIIIGTMGGATASEIPLWQLLSRRLQVIGTALRSRSKEDKAKLTREFSEFALPLFREGRLVPVIDSVFDWNEAAEAHRYMESNANIGKIVLRIGN